jgi:hypothetical protein
MAEVLQGTDEPQRAGAGRAPESDRRTEDVDPKAEPTVRAGSRGRWTPAVEGLAPLVEEALRRVHDPGRLADSGLIGRLACTMAFACHEQRNGRPGELTPLERARALRETLLSALRRLHPDGVVKAGGGGETARFNVLWNAYVDGMPTRQIMHRYAISESTLHRYRRDGVRALARELSEQEDLLRRTEPDVASG